MAKLEIGSDLCSFWHNTNVPVTANRIPPGQPR